MKFAIGSVIWYNDKERGGVLAGKNHNSEVLLQGKAVAEYNYGLF